MFFLNIIRKLKDLNLDLSIKPFSDKNDPSWQLVEIEVQNYELEKSFLKLFKEFFVESTADGNDDLLFFVVKKNDKKEPNGKEETSLEENVLEEGEILVRRKVNNKMPAQIPAEDLIFWKKTFFLNLIIQLTCFLTVSVCQRGNITNSQKSEEEKSLKDLNDNFGENGMELKGISSTATKDKEDKEKDRKLQKNKTKMVCINRVTKKVYSAPYKSRMDVKDASMTEPSYPLVYYTINDYESKDLHLKIKEQQYLCVELSIVYPIAYIENAKNLDIEGLLNSIDLKKDSLPFPVPEGYKKIIFFQGAVPFSSLIEIYQQKVITSNTGIQNKLKQSWGKLNQTSNSSTSGDKLNERVEYIMMRGPHGKGQCQVAIKEVENSANGGASLRNKNSSSWLKGFSTNIINSTSLLFDNNETKSLSLTVDELMCSMTYVNIPWQSIISDLLEK